MNHVTTFFKFIIGFLALMLLLSAIMFGNRYYRYTGFTKEANTIIQNTGGVNDDSRQALNELSKKYQNQFIATPKVSSKDKDGTYHFDTSSQHQGYGKQIHYNVHIQIPYGIHGNVRPNLNDKNIHGVFVGDISNITESQAPTD